MKRKKIVFTYGAFDLLHPGHIRLLEGAKRLGGYLIVGIVADRAVRKLKGEGRPVQTQKDRACVVGSLKCVDEIVLQDKYDPSCYLRTRGWKIDFLVKGDDWDYIPGAETIKKLGGTLVKLPYSKKYSTSNMIDKIRKR